MNSFIVRLHGKAFEVANSTPLKTIKQLKDLLRKLYLKQRDLDSINHEVRGVRQRREESMRQFARRLEILRGHTQSCILACYKPEIMDASLMDFDRKITGSFVVGLSDTMIKT